LNARERLEQYLLEVRHRLRTVAFARAAAVVALTALLLTLVAVWALSDSGFTGQLVLIARIGLLLALIVAGIAMLWRPLSALRPKTQAKVLERHLPAQQGRVETYLELARRREQGLDAPLIDLLAEDALTVAAQSPAEEVVPPKRSLVPAAIGTAAVAALVLMLVAGPAFWGFGSRHLWFGAELPKETIVARNIAVSPGDITVRKNQDVSIGASVSGFRPAEALVHVRFGDSDQWERAPMKVGEDGKFEFTVFALREPLSYYVTSGNTRSAEHRIAIVDLPRIEKMRLTFTYPEWTGLEPETVESAQDIHVVAGTKVGLEVQTTTPLESPQLMVNGESWPLKAEGTKTTGMMVVKGGGTYRVGAMVADELVALTDEHQISLIVDEKPTIEVEKPGRDWYANAVEEVPVHVRAVDDFRVQNVEVRYAVNGGEWKSTPLKGRAKEVKADTLLSLEEVVGDAERLSPGDIVSYYAVAKDRRQSAQTDLFLVQVMPFDRRFTQGQGGGAGGGGMGGEQENAISQRQREILLATWKLQRTRAEAKGREAERLEDNARMLAELQGTLAEQARTLIERTQARALVDQDPKIRQFVENLEQAAEAMMPAVKHLSEIELDAAIPPEQKALQHLLRAEALVTEIQVSFQSSNAGGGGAAGRDLSEMFELEMDLEKNQYETEARARQENNSPEELAEAIRKLRELAARQERLARDAANDRQSMRERNRWQQEQLRRETEDLRRRLQEMAKRESQNGQQQSGEQSGQQRSASNSASEALNQVEDALENMQGASQGSSSSGNGQSGQRSAQEASRNLRQALQQIEKARRDGMSNSFEDLAQRAQAMVDEQRRTEDELHEALTNSKAPGASGERRFAGLDWERAEQLAEAKRGLQQEVQALERDMRGSAQRHREDAPKGAERLSEAATNLGESNLSAGLARSALELERGRAVQAAARDGLITEALENLKNDLGEAARVASAEGNRPGRQGAEASPEELLAELADLRRAWAEAQARAAEDARNGRDPRGTGRGDPNDPNDPRGAGRGDPNDPNDPRFGRGGDENDPRLARGGDPSERGGREPNEDGQPGDGGEQQDGQQGDSRSAQNQQGQQGGSQSGGSASGGAQDGGARAAGGNRTGGWAGWNAGPWSGHFLEGERGRLNAWNPPYAGDRLRPQDAEEFQRQAAEIGRRLREMMNRLPRGALPQTDITALRQLAERLRQMNRADPLTGEYERMMGLVDQVELAALGAAEKARGDAPTRAATPNANSPGYRDNVAEYYRRLGSGPSTR
jgi:hypothetical protein